MLDLLETMAITTRIAPSFPVLAIEYEAMINWYRTLRQHCIDANHCIPATATMSRL